jgi:hypothetical protein
VTESGGPLGFGDESEPERGARKPEREPDLWLPGQRPESEGGERPPRSRLPGLVLMVACFGLLVLVAINTLRTEGVSTRGPASGSQIPPFAAPLVLSDVEGDVNLARKPGQGAAGEHPACQVRLPGVITSCGLTERRPAVIAFLTGGQPRCVRQIDVLDRALRAHPEVAGLAVAIRGDRGELRSLVTRHAWRLKVAQDRDGGMANVFGVAVCPQMTFVLPGGTVEESTVGELDRAALERRLTQLERDAAKPPTGTS